jgi:Tfp pilus assembly protein FimT
VVLALIGLLLFFTVPRVQQILIPNDAQKAVRWFMTHAQAARRHAFFVQSRVVLHVGITEGRLWVTEETMSEEAARAAREEAFILDAGVRIRKVEYAGQDAVVSGVAEIAFYPDGHADPAWIHMTDAAKKPVRLFVEPFLPRVRYLDAKDENAPFRTSRIHPS